MKNTIGKQLVESGLKQEAHDSVRRAIKKILKRSTGRVPVKDLQEIIKITALAL